MLEVDSFLDYLHQINSLLSTSARIDLFEGDFQWIIRFIDKCRHAYPIVKGYFPGNLVQMMGSEYSLSSEIMKFSQGKPFNVFWSIVSIIMVCNKKMGFDIILLCIYNIYETNGSGKKTFISEILKQKKITSQERFIIAEVFCTHDLDLLPYIQKDIISYKYKNGSGVALQIRYQMDLKYGRDITMLSRYYIKQKKNILSRHFINFFNIDAVYSLCQFISAKKINDFNFTIYKTSITLNKTLLIKNDYGECNYIIDSLIEIFNEIQNDELYTDKYFNTSPLSKFNDFMRVEHESLNERYSNFIKFIIYCFVERFNVISIKNYFSVCDLNSISSFLSYFSSDDMIAECVVDFIFTKLNNNKSRRCVFWNIISIIHEDNHFYGYIIMSHCFEKILRCEIDINNFIQDIIIGCCYYKIDNGEYYDNFDNFVVEIINKRKFFSDPYEVKIDKLISEYFSNIGPVVDW